jgi:phage shock protein A
VENLKTALHKLDQKLAEAQSKCDLLIAQHRRSRALGKATAARMAIGDESNAATFDRMKNKVRRSEAVSQATAELVADDVDDRFAALEKEEQIDKLLAELKSRRGA